MLSTYIGILDRNYTEFGIIVTEAASTPASFIGMQLGSTAYSKVGTAQGQDVTIMLAVKVCGAE